MSHSIFGWGYISRGELSSPKFWVGLLIKGAGERGSDIFRIFFGGGGGGGLSKKGWGQYFRVGLIPWRALWLAIPHKCFMLVLPNVISVNHKTINGPFWLIKIFFCRTATHIIRFSGHQHGNLLVIWLVANSWSKSFGSKKVVIA